MALNQEELKNRFTYCEDGSLLRNPNGKPVICSPSKNHRYLRIRINGKTYALHRVIFLLINGYLPKGIDHVDGDRFNNRIENLRAATQRENCLNRVTHKSNKTGYKNVYWQKNMNKYGVALTIDRKRHIVGYFDDIEIANLLAHEYRDKYHGQFSRS
jgi:hypothetical protein